MNVTICSFVMMLLWSSLFILIFHFCRHNNAFILKFGLAALLALFAGCLARCFLPFEFAGTPIVVSIFNIYPVVHDFLTSPLFPLPLSPIDLFVLLWAAVALVLLIRLAAQVRRFFRYIRRARVPCSRETELLTAQAAAKQKIKKNIPVYYLPGICVPMIAGYLHPMVLLPDIVYSREELSHVLNHELTHYRHKDLWVKLLVQIACCLLWWNPLMLLLRSDLSQTLELKCDYTVTAALSKKERISYLGTILKTLKLNRRKPETKIGAVASTSNFTGHTTDANTKQRFHMVLEYQPHQMRQWLCAGLLAAVMVLCVAASYLVIVQPGWEPTAADFGDGVAVNNDNSYIVQRADGSYYMHTEGPDGPIKTEIDSDSLPILKDGNFPIVRER